MAYFPQPATEKKLHLAQEHRRKVVSPVMMFPSGNKWGGYWGARVSVSLAECLLSLFPNNTGCPKPRAPSRFLYTVVGIDLLHANISTSPHPPSPRFVFDLMRTGCDNWNRRLVSMG